MTSHALNWNDVHRQLHAFVYKKVRDKSLTEDIVHDVFVKVHTKLEQVNDANKISAWIFQITRNTIIDHYRHNNKTASVPDIEWESNTANFNECASDLILKLIPTLPDKYRIPLEMTELQKVSQLEVAKKLGLTYTTTKTRVQRARRMLKNKMETMLILKTDRYGNVIVCIDRGNCCNT